MSAEEPPHPDSPMITISLKSKLLFGTWLTLLVFSYNAGIDIFRMYLIISGFILIYICLSGERREIGVLSPYPLLNPNNERFLGDNDPDFASKQLRGSHHATREVPMHLSQSTEQKARNELMKILRTAPPPRNTPCPCGSGQKFKACPKGCFALSERFQLERLAAGE